MVRRSKLLVEPGIVLRHFDETGAEELTQQWLNVYGVLRHGVNTKEFLWHIFSGDRYTSLTGAAAIAQYQQQLAVEYVILSNDRKTAFTTDKLPTKAAFSDYYVFPVNLAWTMAFTHESGWLGPYFAKHANYEKLNEANLLQMRKTQELVLAKAKGWS